MTIRKKTVRLAAALAAIMILSVFVFAADGAYDSTSDPLISKSYLDQRIGELDTTIASLKNDIGTMSTDVTALKADLKTLRTTVDEIVKQNTSLQTEIEALKAEVADLNELIDNMSASAGTGYVVELVEKGKTIYAKGGPVEIIVRIGSAKVVSPFNNQWARQGLSDNTAGCDVFDGEYVAPNHILLIPRGDDGRGVTVCSADAYIMIRGSYVIE